MIILMLLKQSLHCAFIELMVPSAVCLLVLDNQKFMTNMEKWILNHGVPYYCYNPTTCTLSTLDPAYSVLVCTINPLVWFVSYPPRGGMSHRMPALISVHDDIIWEQVLTSDSVSPEPSAAQAAWKLDRLSPITCKFVNALHGRSKRQAAACFNTCGVAVTQLQSKEM